MNNNQMVDKENFDYNNMIKQNNVSSSLSIYSQNHHS